MRDERRSNRDKVTFSLDNRQIAMVFVGSVAALAIVFAIGVVVGKGLVMIQATVPPQAGYETAADEGVPSAGTEEITDTEGSVIFREDALLEVAEAVPEAEKEPDAEEGKIKYTFYDTLEGTSDEESQAETISSPAEALEPDKNLPPPPIIEPEVTLPVMTADSGPVKEPVQALPKESPKKPPKASAPGKGLYYTVQVAAFQDAAQAKRMRDRLKAKGLAAYLTEATVKGRLWHRVRVGKFADRAGAENIAQAIQEKEKLSTFIDIIYE